MELKLRNFCSPHLHVSSLDTAATPEAFAKKEVELGTGVLTCTDHGSMSGLYKAYELAKKNKLIAAPGCEIYFRSNDCPILTKAGIQKTSTVPKGMDKAQWATDHPEGTFYDYWKYGHGTLGYRDYDAYLTGVRLLSRADDRAEVHGSELKPLFGWDDIEELAAKNTTMGSGCLAGMISRHLIIESTPKEKRLEIARAYFERLLHLFGDRFYVELFPHVCSHYYASNVTIETNVKKHVFYKGKKIRTESWEGDVESFSLQFKKLEQKIFIAIKNRHVWEDLETPEEILKVTLQDGFVQNECSPTAPGGDIQYGLNVLMRSWAKKYKVPILVSDDAHFCDPKQKIVQDIRLSNYKKTWKFWGSYHRQSSEEAFEYFKSKLGVPLQEFEGWVDNSYQWAEGFKGFEFDTTIQLPTKFYPQDTLKYTKELILKKGRLNNNPVYLARLKEELDRFHRNGIVDLLPYFWINSVDCCDVYARQGILTGPGRGSVGGTLLAYLLGITHVDPIKYDLSLDRFFNTDRLKARRFPDIDQDLPSRDLLTGMECDTIEFEMEDGSKHILPEWFKVETDLGDLTIKEALEKGAEVKPWWITVG